MNKLYRRCKQMIIAELKKGYRPESLDVALYAVAYELGMDMKDVERIYKTI